MQTVVSGFLLGLSLILPIGAQNSLVLRLGLLGRHVLPVVVFCALSDAILIAAGVWGFSGLLALVPQLQTWAALGGGLFLLAYGAQSYRTALRGGQKMGDGDAPPSVWRTLGVAAAMTWLNPHVYLDTVALVGAVANQSPSPFLFGLGAIIASFSFFFGLGFGARGLAPIMRSPLAWRVLDGFIGTVMLILAVKLLWPLIP
jgi:L-lysine exporter family protein LysE/ArgO